MPDVDEVTEGEIIEEAWGDSVAAEINALRAHSHDGTADAPPDVSHDDLADLTTDNHHAKSHGHTGADGSGTVSHANTTGKTANDHHNQAHAISGADHTGTIAAAQLDFAETADIQPVGTANAAGANTEVAGGGHVHKGDWDGQVDKTANEDVTNSAALQNDDELSFATDASKAYWIEVFLAYELQSGSAADLKVAVGEDASVRGAFHYIGISAAEAAQEGSIAADQTATVAFGGTANLRLARLVGVYRGNGGTFRVKWAQNTATAGVFTRVRAGSFLRYRIFG